MKLTKFLFSVNLAAAIPVAVQASASAQDNAVNKDEWLKDNIFALDKSGQPTSLNETQIAKAITRAKTKDQNENVSGNTVMRPFVPNRKLPHRWELESALKAQEPKMAPDPVSSLKGVVSGYFQPREPRQTISTTNVNVISPTSVSGLRENKTRFERIAEMTRNLIKSMPAASRTTARKTANASPSNVAIQPIRDLALATRNQTQVDPAGGFPMLQRAEKVLFANENRSSAQNTTAKLALTREQQAIAELSQGESEENSEQVFGTANSAGPPPFPLNLLPEQSLKNFVRGLGPVHTSSPRVYFGSWHRSAKMSTLPPCGFKSYSLSKSQKRVLSGLPKSSTTSNLLKPKEKNRLTPVSKQFLVSRAAEPRVATYPPYRMSTGLY